MTARTPEDLTRIARLGAIASWAKTFDRSARTAPARRAALERFERQVDPDGLLSPVDRAEQALIARRDYFHELAEKSIAVRRANAAAKTQASA